MSCKYSSTALLLLLGSCLSLCLLCTPASSAGVYASYSNVVFSNRAWVGSEQRDVRPRFGSDQPALDERDLQRPQPEAVPSATQNWNSNRRNVETHVAPQRQPAPVAAATSGARATVPAESHSTVPATAPAAAPAAPAAPAVTVHGVDGPPSQAAGRPSSPPIPTRPPPPFNHREHFSSMLFQPISRGNAHRNLVYSPASIHAMLGMLYGVSSGQTADELRRAGQFGTNQLAVAKDFQRLNQLNRQLDNALLIVANKLYYNNELTDLNPDYRRYANEFYSSDIEAVNMKTSVNTAARINAWASDATRNIIRELVSPSDIDADTEALLVNAIYFKARWANEFSAMDTTADKFWQSNNAPITVAMMYNDDIFSYAELPELDAKALELPYMGTEASMLLLLPNQVNGLAQLEQRLASSNHDLNFIAGRLNREMVTVRLPKFRIEFEQDMTGPLQKLGVRRMFTKNSQVDAMLSQPVRVSKILQKAFIDVNEAGSEAAAASYAKFVPLSLPVKSREFTADHPFLFAIRTPETVLFIGHVVQPPQLTLGQ